MPDTQLTTALFIPVALGLSDNNRWELPTFSSYLVPQHGHVLFGSSEPLLSFHGHTSIQTFLLQYNYTLGTPSRPECSISGRNCFLKFSLSQRDGYQYRNRADGLRDHALHDPPFPKSMPLS